MTQLIDRRDALGLALAAVPCAATLLAPQPAHAANSKLLTANVDDGASEGSGGSTETVVSVKYAGITLLARAKVQGSSWSAWQGASAAVGKTNSAGIVQLRINFKDLQGLTGTVSYSVYKRDKGWQAWVKNGAATASVRNVEAVRVKLSGEVARHYDVMYRVYMSGRGWGKWTKNGGSAGAVGKKSRVNALQVKLTPKTEEAAGAALSKVGVRYQGQVRKTGWQAWTGDGKTAGTTGKALALGCIALMADAGNSSGSIKYRAHVASIGWQDWKADGASAGSGSHNLEAVQIKLTGKISSSYDVYYRAHVANYGWLDWAKNGATAGSTGFSIRMEALQVKLVKKGKSAPGDTRFPTVNKLESSKRMNGIDISSWQAGINIAKVPGHFVVVKSTQGNWYTNPYFKQQANATLACGKSLGIYHFADLKGNAAKQADYFVKSVKPYIGRCVLVLDWEGDALKLGPDWAKKFLDRVYAKTGVKPLIYMSQSQTWAYDWSSVAPKYKLWVAQYLYRNMNTGYLSSPAGGTDVGYWSKPTMYQYSSTGRLKNYGSSLDLNKFYGSAAIWRQLANGS